VKTCLRHRLLVRILAVVLLTVAVSAPLTAQAQTLKVIHSFTGSPDGGDPAGLTLDAAGNVYGATFSGGVPGCYSDIGCGAVFELTPSSGSWVESVLYAFSGGADGANPSASVTLDKAGNLYGTTYAGGIAGCTYGAGVAFELTSGSGGWTESVLHDFQVSDGCGPEASLVFDKAGNLYSTLPNGSKNGKGDGSVYKLTDGSGGWKEQSLYSFNGNSTGIQPTAAPILDAAGNLYGTTSCCGTGGAVWELLHGSWKERTLYSFASGGGGKSEAGLVFDKVGNLYGQTELGGKYDKGVVFKLAPAAKGNWKETVLYSFKGGRDGEYPISSVPVFDEAGNVYGTTTQGGGTGCGGKGCGTVFKLTPGKGGHWRETVVHRFADADGRWPYYGVVIDRVGNLYGTTGFGGNAGCFQNYGCGVVFEITQR
jgi:hypothetical protein